MKNRIHKTILCLLLALSMLAVAACSSKGAGQGNGGTAKAPQETTTQAESTEGKKQAESEDAASSDAKAHFEGQTFAQAHDAFQTKLAQENAAQSKKPQAFSQTCGFLLCTKMNAETERMYLHFLFHTPSCKRSNILFRFQISYNGKFIISASTRNPFKDVRMAISGTYFSQNTFRLWA